MNRLSTFAVRVIGRLIKLLTKVQNKFKESQPTSVPQKSNNLLLYPIESLPNLMNEKETYQKIFYQLEEHGVHITRNDFYSPIPNVREIQFSKLWEKESELVGINLDIAAQLFLLQNVFP
jgi:hypothetical protein